MKHPRPWAKFHITPRERSMADYHAVVSEVMTQLKRRVSKSAQVTIARKTEKYDG